MAFITKMQSCDLLAGRQARVGQLCAPKEETMDWWRGVSKVEGKLYHLYLLIAFCSSVIRSILRILSDKGEDRTSGDALKGRPVLGSNPAAISVVTSVILGFPITYFLPINHSLS